MAIPGAEQTLSNLTERLLSLRVSSGHWEGKLSSSALSTATACAALAIVEGHEPLVTSGLDWLARNQNHDGGWGDTVISKSNISTTLLCWAACSFGHGENQTQATRRAESWLTAQAGGLEPDQLAEAVSRRYGKDRTFSVPILTVLALARKLDWKMVPQLPFELAACPHQWWQWLRLPVVSYALPALIAIGQIRHHQRPTRNPITRGLRASTRASTLKLLSEIQPASGGFLEAVPLTSFVTMSLVAGGQRDHSAVKRGVDFLVRSARDDGSWPIDTNLATWVTTLSVNALSNVTPVPDRKQILDWLLAQQYIEEHPYTHAAPGGWAWTDLSGGVPDADDTAGALLALRSLGCLDTAVATAGARWLLGLQNSDGGIPTFCRGWGALPFDRSSPDLTAHALAAWTAWQPDLPIQLGPAIDRAVRFLAKTQHADGSWTPLWFGNEHTADEENRTYGTSRVLLAPGLPQVMRTRGFEWLTRSQNRDGGWGGGAGAPSSIEETSLALEALSGHGNGDSITRGIQWLVEATDQGLKTPPSAIGLYFAKLWYFEELYPLIFAVAALSRCLRPRD